LCDTFSAAQTLSLGTLGDLRVAETGVRRDTGVSGWHLALRFDVPGFLVGAGMEENGYADITLLRPVPS
jgi:hypothetical protein